VLAAGQANVLFHWSSPEVMRALAEHFGFDVEVCDLDPYHRRDGHLVLRFARPAVAAANQ
jgi:hypothetical protein